MRFPNTTANTSRLLPAHEDDVRASTPHGAAGRPRVVFERPTGRARPSPSRYRIVLPDHSSYDCPSVEDEFTDRPCQIYSGGVSTSGSLLNEAEGDPNNYNTMKRVNRFWFKNGRRARRIRDASSSLVNSRRTRAFRNRVFRSEFAAGALF
ncbi:hypothetical protein EVAR_94425_1 [Eumeta japonica]|uniref:Uncharacterized protein n=1 Tax=Eumeta variegata TaxID=151549 RepID=A0A4C1TQ41_EUMVA|nr:hypothetical protein EVAR_94425_1 [Eumeta japonica]